MSYIQQLQNLSEDERAQVIEDRLIETCHLLLDTDEFEQEAGRTSAVGWGMEEWEVLDVDLDDDECRVRFSFAASGDPPDDGVFDGDCVSGEAEMVLDETGHVTFRLLEAEVSDGADWEDE